VSRAYLYEKISSPYAKKCDSENPTNMQMAPTRKLMVSGIAAKKTLMRCICSDACVIVTSMSGLVADGLSKERSTCFFKQSA
jgi:hypothetical protein